MEIIFYRFEFKPRNPHQQRLIVNIAAKDFREACAKAARLHPDREVLLAAYGGMVQDEETA